MRIAFFTETFRENTGGLTRAVIQLHDRLKARGHEVHVFTLPQQRTGPFHPAELTLVPALPLPAMGGLPAGRWIAYDYPFILNHLARWRAASAAAVPTEVVHLHTPFPLGWLGMRAAHRLGLPVVVTCHANIPRSGAVVVQQVTHLPLGRTVDWAARAEIAFYNRADVVITPSQTMARQLLNRGLRSPIAVVSNGVDVERFTPAPATPSTAACAPNPGPTSASGVTNPAAAGALRPPTALYAGRLSAEKGMNDLLVAIGCLLRAHPEVRFRVAGDGPWRTRLAANRQSRLELLGYVPWEQMPDVYHQADVLVFPSPVETQGLVVLEAMACGLPVIGVRAGAVPELVQDGVNGFLVPPGPSSQTGPALAELASRLLADQPLRQAMAARARQTARHHSLDHTVLQLEQLYETLLIVCPPRPHKDVCKEAYK